jgi:hypothetical protein
MRVLRRLRAGLPDRDADREVGHRDRPARAFGGHDLRLLRRRLLFKAEMRGEEVVRMVPYKDGKANHGHSCVKGRFAWGYATHKDRILKPMIREKITDPWREVSWDEAIGLRRLRVQAHPGKYGRDSRRRHHLVALHQRGNLSGAEAGPRRLRQQQRRHLRARLPFADRLWPEDDLRHSAGTQDFDSVERPTSSWSSAPIRPTPIRCSPRA